MAFIRRLLFGNDTDSSHDEVSRVVGIGEGTPTLASDVGIAWAVGTSPDLKLELKQKGYTDDAFDVIIAFSQMTASLSVFVLRVVDTPYLLIPPLVVLSCLAVIGHSFGTVTLFKPYVDIAVLLIVCLGAEVSGELVLATLVTNVVTQIAITSRELPKSSLALDGYYLVLQNREVRYMRDYFYSGTLANYYKLNAAVAILIVPIYLPISILAAVVICGFKGGCVTQYRMLVRIFEELKARYTGAIQLHPEERERILEYLRTKRALWLDPETTTADLDDEAVTRLALSYVQEQVRVAGILKSGYTTFSSTNALVTDVVFREEQEDEEDQVVVFLTLVGLEQKGP